MSVCYRQPSETVGTPGNPDVVLTVPTGTQSTDMLCAFLCSDASDSGGFNTPAGWTREIGTYISAAPTPPIVNDGAGGKLLIAVFTKVAGATVSETFHSTGASPTVFGVLLSIFDNGGATVFCDSAFNSTHSTDVPGSEFARPNDFPLNSADPKELSIAMAGSDVPDGVIAGTGQIVCAQQGVGRGTFVGFAVPTFSQSNFLVEVGGNNPSTDHFVGFVVNFGVTSPSPSRGYLTGYSQAVNGFPSDTAAIRGTYTASIFSSVGWTFVSGIIYIAFVRGSAPVSPVIPSGDPPFPPWDQWHLLISQDGGKYRVYWSTNPPTAPAVVGSLATLDVVQFTNATDVLVVGYNEMDVAGWSNGYTIDAFATSGPINASTADAPPITTNFDEPHRLVFCNWFDGDHTTTRKVLAPTGLLDGYGGTIDQFGSALGSGMLVTHFPEPNAVLTAARTASAPVSETWYSAQVAVRRKVRATGGIFRSTDFTNTSEFQNVSPASFDKNHDTYYHINQAEDKMTMVACGTRIDYSLDHGQTWHDSNIKGPSHYNDDYLAGAQQPIAFSPTHAVVVGENSSFPDQATNQTVAYWAARSNLAVWNQVEVETNTYGFTGAAYGAGAFVAGCYQAIYTSLDHGQTWSKTLDTSGRSEPNLANASWLTIVYNGSYFLAFSDQDNGTSIGGGWCAKSVDGQTWTVFNAFGKTFFGSPLLWVYWNGALWVVIDQYSHIYTSLDGVTSPMRYDGSADSFGSGIVPVGSEYFVFQSSSSDGVVVRATDPTGVWSRTLLSGGGANFFAQGWGKPGNGLLVPGKSASGLGYGGPGFQGLQVSTDDAVSFASTDYNPQKIAYSFSPSMWAFDDPISSQVIHQPSLINDEALYAPVVSAVAGPRLLLPPPVLPKLLDSRHLPDSLDKEP